MSYDFSGFKHNPPSGFDVVRADTSMLKLHHVKSGKTYVMKKTGEQFEISYLSKALGEKEGFIMRTDDVGRYFKFLGYVK